MTTITIEMEDTLQDSIDACIFGLHDLILEFVADNPEANDICLFNDIDRDGLFREMVDGNTPDRCKEIDDLYYLHGDELDEAYNNAGIFSDRPDNWKQASIFIYLRQEANEWFLGLDLDMNAWRESGEPFEDFIDWNLPTAD